MSRSQESVSSRIKANLDSHVTRRSQLEKRIDVLRVVRDGAEARTEIMYKANLAWSDLQKSLASLMSFGLLAEKKFGSRKMYTITPKGSELLQNFDAVLEEIDPMHRMVDFAAQPRSTSDLEAVYTAIEERLGRLEETMEVVSDKGMLVSIREGLKDLKAGRYKKYASVKEYAKTLR